MELEDVLLKISLVIGLTCVYTAIYEGPKFAYKSIKKRIRNGIAEKRIEQGLSYDKNDFQLYFNFMKTQFRKELETYY